MKTYAQIFIFFSISSPVLAADAVREIEQTMQAYAQAWSSHDPAAVAGFYHEPAMRVSAEGPAVRQTRGDQEVFFTGFLAGLVSRGYDKSAWEKLYVHLLDGNTAVVSGVTVRSRADGELFERVAITYLLWNTTDGWKIFLSTTHSPETVLQSPSDRAGY